MRLSRIALALAACGLGAAACFQGWPVVGPYACGSGCPSGMTCDDGLCCVPDGTPVCPTLVPDGGICPDGSGPLTYYEDKDHDGYGNPNAPKKLCARPLVDSYVTDHTDCDDTSAAVNPAQVEKCDGLDNNCNGTIDEGFPTHTYYRDQDGDGYGDPNTTVSACAAPPGFVDNNSDCEPLDVNAHPGGTELCNGVDDDCDGVTDDHLTDVGQSCSDAGVGVCAQGTYGCVGGVRVCQSTATPSAEKCNGLDDDCNGLVDEPPGCGGPQFFLPSDAGVSEGAQNLGAQLSFAETAGSCHKDWPGFSTETWSSPKWTGAGSNDHIVYFENPDATWDLSKAGLQIHLDVSWTMVTSATTPWAASSQPVVFLCSANGSFNRYVHVSSDGGTYYQDASLLLNASGSTNRHIPLGGGNGWVLGAGSGADLTQVKRVEILVRPSSSTPAASFTFSFAADNGFN